MFVRIGNTWYSVCKIAKIELQKTVDSVQVWIKFIGADTMERIATFETEEEAVEFVEKMFKKCKEGGEEDETART